MFNCFFSDNERLFVWFSDILSLFVLFRSQLDQTGKEWNLFEMSIMKFYLKTISMFILFQLQLLRGKEIGVWGDSPGFSHVETSWGHFTLTPVISIKEVHRAAALSMILK